MDAVVIAGGIPKPEDPLYEYTKGENKALLEISGRTMIQWVLDALNKADRAEQIVIIGLPEDSQLNSEKISATIQNQGDLLSNIKAGVQKIIEINPHADLILIVSSDIPTIKPEMINWLIETCEQSEHDVYYTVVSRNVMEERFPESNRSYVRLKDMDLCGGDMNVIRAKLISQNNDLWRRLVEARKNALKQAMLIGIDNLVLLLLRIIDLDGAVKRVSKRLKIKGRAILSPYAEIAMDVDKPHQLEIVRTDLDQQVS